MAGRTESQFIWNNYFIDLIMLFKNERWNTIALIYRRRWTVYSLQLYNGIIELKSPTTYNNLECAIIHKWCISVECTKSFWYLFLLFFFLLSHPHTYNIMHNILQYFVDSLSICYCLTFPPLVGFCGFHTHEILHPGP